jgi:hypothetical protein
MLPAVSSNTTKKQIARRHAPSPVAMIVTPSNQQTLEIQARFIQPKAAVLANPDEYVSLLYDAVKSDSMEI